MFVVAKGQEEVLQFMHRPQAKNPTSSDQLQKKLEKVNSQHNKQVIRPELLDSMVQPAINEMKLDMSEQQRIIQPQEYPNVYKSFAIDDIPHERSELKPSVVEMQEHTHSLPVESKFILSPKLADQTN